MFIPCRNVAAVVVVVVAAAVDLSVDRVCVAERATQRRRRAAR